MLDEQTWVEENNMGPSLNSFKAAAQTLLVYFGQTANTMNTCDPLVASILIYADLLNISLKEPMD